MVLWWEPTFLEPFYPKNHFLLKNQGTQPKPPIVKGDPKNLPWNMGQYWTFPAVLTTVFPSGCRRWWYWSRSLWRGAGWRVITIDSNWIDAMPEDFFETWLLQWQGDLYDTLTHSLVKFWGLNQPSRYMWNSGERDRMRWGCWRIEWVSWSLESFECQPWQTCNVNCEGMNSGGVACYKGDANTSVYFIYIQIQSFKSSIHKTFAKQRLHLGGTLQRE